MNIILTKKQKQKQKKKTKKQKSAAEFYLLHDTNLQILFCFLLMFVIYKVYYWVSSDERGSFCFC